MRFSSPSTSLRSSFESLIMGSEYITLLLVRTTFLDESHEKDLGKEV